MKESAKSLTPYPMPVKKGSYTDEAGNDGEGSGAGSGTWSISQPLPYDVHMTGVPKVSVKVDTQVPDAHLIAIHDIDAKGEATLISRGAYLIREAGKLSFEMYPQDWKLEKGHRLGFLVTGSDENWFSSVGTTNTTVDVTKGAVRCPSSGSPGRSSSRGARRRP